MITYARLQHFRSYTDDSFEFDTGVNIIVGPNASGKTTLIEAIAVGLSGKSFKARDVELIEEGKEWMRIDIGAISESRICKVVREGDKSAKTFEIDGKSYKRLSAQKAVPITLFEPNHLQLLHGSPEMRRTFLDDLIAQIKPGFDATRRHYKRVLAQRNALLKQHGTHTNNEQLFVWNLRLSELGGKIVAERLALIERFSESLSQLYSDIAGIDTKVTIEYASNISQKNYETALLHALERNMDRDSLLGFTSAGPHREDFTLAINDSPASQSASRGEVRTMLLVLKMLEAQFIEDVRNIRPILLLDDVFSELDGKRRQALVNFLSLYQSFITTTDADVVIDHFSESAHVIPTQ
jgi:DNA replication and repair protein RecF